MHLIYGPALKEPSDRDIERGLDARGKDLDHPVVVLCCEQGPPFVALTYADEKTLGSRMGAIERYLSPDGSRVKLERVKSPKASLAVGAPERGTS